MMWSRESSYYLKQRKQRRFGEVLRSNTKKRVFIFLTEISAKLGGREKF